MYNNFCGHLKRFESQKIIHGTFVYKRFAIFATNFATPKNVFELSTSNFYSAKATCLQHSRKCPFYGGPRRWRAPPLRCFEKVTNSIRYWPNLSGKSHQNPKPTKLKLRGRTQYEPVVCFPMKELHFKLLKFETMKLERVLPQKLGGHLSIKYLKYASIQGCWWISDCRKNCYCY